MSHFVYNLLHGIKDPAKVKIQNEINRLGRQADTMGMYARAARDTFDKTGRESCLSAEARFSTRQCELKAKIYELEKQLGMK